MKKIFSLKFIFIFFRHKRISLGLTIFLFVLGSFLIAEKTLAATTFNDTTADHKWSTAGNWSDGKPDSADAVTVGVGVTSLNIDEVASALSFTPTGTAGITISGSGALSVYGDFTLDAAVTWTNTGILSFYTNTANMDTAGKSLATVASLHVRGGADLTLVNNGLNIGTKALYVYGAGSSLITGNLQIDCGTFGDNGQSGAITLTLGSSVINTVTVSFASATLTVTANTAAITLSVPGTLIYFGGKIWGGTIIITIPNASDNFLMDNNTFGNLTVIYNPTNGYNSLGINADQTISGTLTLTGNSPVGKSNIRGLIYGNSKGTQRTLTAATVTMTGALDFRDIKGAGAGTWNLSTVNSGNLGGNSGITFRSATTYYLCCGANDKQDYEDVYSTTDDGAADGLTIFPLPQDTLIINDNSWSATGKTFLFHANGRTGSVDASALTKANIIGLPVFLYGDLILTGSGVSIPAAGYANPIIDARLRNETGGDTLDINILPFAGNGTITIGAYSGQVGTVRLLTNNLTHTGTFTLTSGTFDLNGKTLTTGTFTSSNTNNRTLQATGGGKIVLNGLTGTVFDTTTGPGTLTISNAPAIDIGDSNNTLTGNVTFIGSGKTYGDFTVKKHAGNFDAIITGTNTFGTITLETPDATYNYSDIQFPASVTTTITGLVADGTATYPININSSSAAAHTLSDTTGTNTVTYTTITYSQATGGATWNSLLSGGNVDGNNNTGWTFDAGAPTNIGISSIVANSTSQLTVTALTAVDLDIGLHATPYWFNETTSNSGASDSSIWQNSTIFIDTGLSVNTQYTYQVKAKDANLNESAYSSTASKYTLANTPASPTVAAASVSSLNVTINENSNPAATTFSIKVGLKYVQADGTLGDSAVYQTKAVWGTPVAIAGLSANTQYAASVNAKNGDGTATDYSATASKYSLAPTPTNLAGTAGQTTMVLSVDSFTNDTTDSAGYYFSRSGANSGWIQTNTWNDSGLTCGTSYVYSIIYRNGDGTETDVASLTKSTTACTAASGSGLPPAAFNQPAIPLSGFGVKINQGNTTTSNRIISLNFNAGSDIKKMAISNSADFNGASLEDYYPNKQWDLCSKFSGVLKNSLCPDGSYTVYVKFYTAYGAASNVISDTIVLGSTGSPQAKNILIKYPNDPKVYLIENGQKQWIKDEQTFKLLNYKWSDIIQISSSQTYPDGTVIQNQSGNNLPVPSSALSQPFNKDLKLGQTNVDIKRLQIFLNSDPATQIAKSGTGSPGKETNFFGVLTKNAVIKFQEKYAKDILAPLGLKKGTGIVSKSTLSKINELIGKSF